MNEATKKDLLAALADIKATQESGRAHLAGEMLAALVKWVEQQ